ncbi:hypothetical protein I4U23_011151 [Adineta vaga]|nr:hypothetical protein I4U23_011151 [Adineta vaga]
MSEGLHFNDRYCTILDEIKQFSEQEEEPSKCMSFDGLNPKERAKIYGIFETTYHRFLQFEKQCTFDNNQKQTVLIVRKIAPEKQLEPTSVTVTDTIVHEFRKYTKLSLPLTKHEFIDYYLDCLDPYTNCRILFSQFIEDIQRYENISRLKSCIEQLLNNIISYLNNHPSTQTFKNNIYEEEMKLLKSSPYKSKGELYKKENASKLFISIDIIKATYNIVKNYHPEIFNHLSTWEEFVFSFCSEKPIHTIAISKPVRERTLGCAKFGKKISSLAEYFIHKVLHEMQINPNDIVNITTDEAILSYDSTIFHRMFNDYHKSFFKVQAFRLVKLPKYDYFVKEYFHPIQGQDSESIEIINRELRCIPMIFIMQCIKQYEDKPILEIDRKFAVESGHIATLDEPIF